MNESFVVVKGKIGKNGLIGRNEGGNLPTLRTGRGTEENYNATKGTPRI